jgi:hypothetical protein
MIDEKKNMADVKVNSAAAQESIEEEICLTDEDLGNVAGGGTFLAPSAHIALEKSKEWRKAGSPIIN